MRWGLARRAASAARSAASSIAISSSCVTGLDGEGEDESHWVSDVLGARSYVLHPNDLGTLLAPGKAPRSTALRKQRGERIIRIAARILRIAPSAFGAPRSTSRDDDFGNDPGMLRAQWHPGCSQSRFRACCARACWRGGAIRRSGCDPSNPFSRLLRPLALKRAVLSGRGVPMTQDAARRTQHVARPTPRRRAARSHPSGRARSRD